MSIEFTLKTDITDEQLKVFDDVKSRSDWSDEDVKKVTIVAWNSHMSSPGKSVKSEWCGYNGTYNTVLNIEHYNLMEPNIATISYLKDDKIHITHYDYKTKLYKDDTNSGKKAVTWPSNKISKLVPKPAVKAGMAGDYTDDRFTFNGFGVDEAFVKDYISLCEKGGFVAEQDNTTNVYKAKNSDGYMLKVSFYEESDQISITLEKPE